MAIARNNVAVSFVNVGGVPTHLGLWSASSGGELKGSTDTSITPTPSSGDTVTYAVNQISVNIPNGELTNSGSDDAVDGFIANTLHVALHSAAPTSGNQLTADDDDRKPLTTVQWTVSAT